jgi:hypothetical protein
MRTALRQIGGWIEHMRTLIQCRRARSRNCPEGQCLRGHQGNSFSGRIASARRRERRLLIWIKRARSRRQALAQQRFHDQVGRAAPRTLCGASANRERIIREAGGSFVCFAGKCEFVPGHRCTPHQPSRHRASRLFVSRSTCPAPGRKTRPSVNPLNCIGGHCPRGQCRAAGQRNAALDPDQWRATDTCGDGGIDQAEEIP